MGIVQTKPRLPHDKITCSGQRNGGRVTCPEREGCLRYATYGDDPALGALAMSAPFCACEKGCDWKIHMGEIK